MLSATTLATFEACEATVVASPSDPSALTLDPAALDFWNARPHLRFGRKRLGREPVPEEQLGVELPEGGGGGGGGGELGVYENVIVPVPDDIGQDLKK